MLLLIWLSYGTMYKLITWLLLLVLLSHYVHTVLSFKNNLPGQATVLRLHECAFLQNEKERILGGVEFPGKKKITHVAAC